MKNIIFIALLLLTACGENKTEFKSHEELDAYINDPENGFIVGEKSADLIFEARLTPPLEGESSEECTVQLRIRRKDGGSVLEHGDVSKEEISEREGYLSFDLINDVSLRIDGKTVNPTFHHYERTYGLKPSVDMYFNFMNLEVDSDVSFTYRDKLFGQGLIKLEFSKDLFNKCYVAKS